jgi:two-component system NarL family response regulator
LREVLEASGFEVVGESHDGLEASRLAGALAPDVVILDLGMPLIGGLSAGGVILRTSPATRLIAVGSSGDALFISSVHEAGFNGYVLRDRSRACLPEAIRAVLDGAVYPAPDPLKAGS